MKSRHEPIPSDSSERLQHANKTDFMMESDDRILSKIEELVRMKEYTKAHALLDDHHRIHHSCAVKIPRTSRMYHPLITNETIERVCQQLEEHQSMMDLATLQKLTLVCQQTRQQRLLVSLEQNKIVAWTTPMYMELIRAVWPGQAKRYFESHILPTGNKSLIRQAVGMIMWKYRALVSKCRPNERGELFETVRIARNFYENYADPLKGDNKGGYIMILDLTKEKNRQCNLSHDGYISHGQNDAISGSIGADTAPSVDPGHVWVAHGDPCARSESSHVLFS